jgi:hypothetical protein
VPGAGAWADIAAIRPGSVSTEIRVDDRQAPPAGGEVGRPGHVAAEAHHDLGPDAIEHLQYRFQCGDNFVWAGSAM